MIIINDDHAGDYVVSSTISMFRFPKGMWKICIIPYKWFLNIRFFSDEENHSELSNMTKYTVSNARPHHNFFTVY